MREIKIGHSKDSETRYISSVRINLKNFGVSKKDEDLILVDCPGTGDSMGAEVDIAN